MTVAAGEGLMGKALGFILVVEEENKQTKKNRKRGVTLGHMGRQMGKEENLLRE